MEKTPTDVGWTMSSLPSRSILQRKVSRGNQSHLSFTQLLVLVSFGAFWFSCGSDTYILFPGLCLSLCFSSKGKKEWKVYVRAQQSSAFAALGCAYRGAEEKLKTGLAQMLLEECHDWRKTTVMWYIFLLLIWCECHGDLVSVSWFLRINNWLASERNQRLN